MNRIWPTLGSVLAAVALVAVLVAPALAAAPSASLRAALVSPRSGTTATTFTFAVTFQDDHGRPPVDMQVQIGGDRHDLRSIDGNDSHVGARFVWSGRLPIGSHAVTFRARTQNHREIDLGAGSVVVSAIPQQSPHPTQTPKPSPTHGPAPHPTPTADPTPTPTTLPIAHPTAAPGATPSPAPSVTVPPRMHDHPVAPSSSAPLPADDPLPSPSGTPAPSDGQLAVLPPASPGVDGPATPGAGGHLDGPGPARHPRLAGPLSAVLATVGVVDLELPMLPLIPTIVTTSGAAAASMALGLFGRRRRDGQPAADEELAAAAADGVGIGRGTAAGLLLEPDLADGDDLEALLPRWRRPSLLQARRSDPLRSEAPAPRLTFASGGPSTSNLERRVVRYTVVRLLDAPDELRGREIGAVGEGDEVGLLEKQGSYWLVLCPNGGQGWLHKMTLGPVPAGYPSMDAPGDPGDAPRAVEDAAADVDDDVLAAYLSSRRRAD